MAASHLGTTPALAAKGITDRGSSSFIRNGPVVTAGGLIFIGTGPDRMIHALDRDTCETLVRPNSPVQITSVSLSRPQAFRSFNSPAIGLSTWRANSGWIFAFWVCWSQ
jgi:hypothetical protein